MPEGAEPGTVPTDIEQATGLERLEILGKMQGIDIFDMKPLPSDRMGTLKEPVVIKSFGGAVLRVHWYPIRHTSRQVAHCMFFSIY